jgi:hypothetical protein
MRSVIPGPVVGATKGAWLGRLLRCPRCEKPLPPPPPAVASLREAIRSLAHAGVLVARSHSSLRSQRCRRCERPSAPSPTAVSPFRESPRAGPPRGPSAKDSRRSGSRPRFTLRGWLARFSPTPSSRNYSCSRPSNQRFQPGAWPCSSGVEVGQAQAEPRVGRLVQNPLDPVSASAARCEKCVVRLPSAPSQFRAFSPPQPVRIVLLSSALGCSSFAGTSRRGVESHGESRTTGWFGLAPATGRFAGRSDPLRRRMSQCRGIPCRLCLRARLLLKRTACCRLPEEPTARSCPAPRRTNALGYE